jgi:hypothetical protein
VIKEYSPNIKWGHQHVEVVLMQWGYSKTIKVDVGGNCHGMSVIDCAAGIICDQLYDEAEVDGAITLVLENAAGDTLLCEDEEDRGLDWIKDMIVSAQIVGWTPPTINEVRKMNGAKPVKDGDRPWSPL